MQSRVDDSPVRSDQVPSAFLGRTGRPSALRTAGPPPRTRPPRQMPRRATGGRCLPCGTAGPARSRGGSSRRASSPPSRRVDQLAEARHAVSGDVILVVRRQDAELGARLGVQQEQDPVKVAERLPAQVLGAVPSRSASVTPCARSRSSTSLAMIWTDSRSPSRSSLDTPTACWRDPSTNARAPRSRPRRVAVARLR